MTLQLLCINLPWSMVVLSAVLASSFYGSGRGCSVSNAHAGEATFELSICVACKGGGPLADCHSNNPFLAGRVWIQTQSGAVVMHAAVAVDEVRDAQPLSRTATKILPLVVYIQYQSISNPQHSS